MKRWDSDTVGAALLTVFLVILIFTLLVVDYVILVG